MLDLDFNSSSRPQKGSLLIAEPFANDEYFRRSVVLVCDLNPRGCFGFVLNNYLELDFNEFSEENLEIDTRVSIGGPVDINNLYYIHKFGNSVPDSMQIAGDIYLGGDFKVLVEMLRKDPNPEQKARFFLGYSGWGEKQLEREIEEKSWAVLNSEKTTAIMDTTSQNLWDECLNALGGKHLLFKHFPINPNNN